jgi:hypothetical protein
MKGEDPTRTIHLFVARKMGLRQGDRDGQSVAELAHSLVADDSDPELRADYALAVEVAWLNVAFWCLVGMFVCGVPARELLGESALVVVASVWMGAGFFSVAGAVEAMWRYYYYVPQARQRARQFGVASDLFASSMRRTLPSNRSLPAQVVVGLLAFVITLATL